MLLSYEDIILYEIGSFEWRYLPNGLILSSDLEDRIIHDEVSDFWEAHDILWVLESIDKKYFSDHSDIHFFLELRVDCTDEIRILEIDLWGIFHDAVSESIPKEESYESSLLEDLEVGIDRFIVYFESFRDFIDIDLSWLHDREIGEDLLEEDEILGPYMIVGSDIIIDRLFDRLDDLREVLFFFIHIVGIISWYQIFSEILQDRKSPKPLSDIEMICEELVERELRYLESVDIAEILSKAKPMEMIESCSSREIIVPMSEIERRAPRENKTKARDTIIDILELLLPVCIFMDLIDDEELSIILILESESKIKKLLIEKINIIRWDIERSREIISREMVYEDRRFPDSSWSDDPDQPLCEIDLSHHLSTLSESFID